MHLMTVLGRPPSHLLFHTLRATSMCFYLCTLFPFPTIFNFIRPPSHAGSIHETKPGTL